MALTECPECRRQVSDTASACPGCGFALRKQNSSPVFRILFVLVVTILAFFIGGPIGAVIACGVSIFIYLIVALAEGGRRRE